MSNITGVLSANGANHASHSSVLLVTGTSIEVNLPVARYIFNNKSKKQNETFLEVKAAMEAGSGVVAGPPSLFTTTIAGGCLDLGAVVLSDSYTLYEFGLNNLDQDDVTITFFVEPPSLADQVGFQLQNENLLADIGEEDHNMVTILYT